MKVILRGYGVNMTAQERQAARSQARDMVIARGTGRIPGAPRDVFLQSGPRGILVNFRQPDGYNDDIVGFRIYKDDETSLFAEIHDGNTTQHFIEATSGSTPPVTNIFVSSLNQLGIESPKVQAQGSSTTEAGAPSMPSTPPTYNRAGGGGSCFTGNTRVITRLGIKQLAHIQAGDEVLTQRGWRRVKTLLEHGYEGPLHDMGNDEYVTPSHRFWFRVAWSQAVQLFRPILERFTGKVFNLEIDGDGSDEEQCYTLANGHIAHNVRKV